MVGKPLLLGTWFAANLLTATPGMRVSGAFCWDIRESAARSLSCYCGDFIGGDRTAAAALWYSEGPKSRPRSGRRGAAIGNQGPARVLVAEAQTVAYDKQ
jgi:hypothetical protein